MPEFIYQMRAVRKAHGDKVILDNVTLAFLPGAKIGVVGPNGTGKSTLLRMMAGVEQPSNGDARLMPGFTVGLLAQEPELDETKTVLGNVEDGVAETKRLLDRIQRDRREDGDRLLRRPARADGPAAGAARPQGRLGPGQPGRAGHGRAALPAARRRGHQPVRRRTQKGRTVPAAAVPARPAAARRAHQPPGRRERAVAGAAPGEVPGHRRRGHPRPVLPGRRGPVDPRARPRPRLPVRGQLLHLPGDQGGPAQGRGGQGRQEAQAPGGRARVGPVQPAGPPDQEPGPAAAVRGDGRRGRQEPQARLRGDPDPAGPPPGQRGGRGRQPGQGLRRPVPVREPLLQPAPQRHRRRPRPERSRQDHPVQDDRRRGEAGRGHDQGRRDGHDLLRRPGPGAHRPEEERLGGRSPTARRTSASATSRSPAARTWPRSGSRARTSRSRPASCPAASGTG